MTIYGSLNMERKIGIALGGGGARGFAHIGALKILDEAGIRPDVVVGTSMGSIMGALYAQLGSAQAVIDRLQIILKEQGSGARELNVYPENQKVDHFFEHVTKEIKERIIINLSISRKALLSSARLERAINSLVGEGRIENLPITFAAMASDLNTGKGVILRCGSLRKAVTASSSIPGFFPPIQWDNCQLVDGEVTDLIPVDVCRLLGADFVIAVDVRRDLETTSEVHHIIDVILRASRITNHRYTEISLSHADVVLHPISKDVKWSEFDRLNELISYGEWEARAKLAEIKQALATDKSTKQTLTARDFRNTHIDLAISNSIARDKA